MPIPFGDESGDLSLSLNFWNVVLQRDEGFAGRRRTENIAMHFDLLLGKRFVQLFKFRGVAGGFGGSGQIDLLLNRALMSKRWGGNRKTGAAQSNMRE